MDQRKGYGASSEQQFVNQTRLPLLCEKSGAILLVLVDRQSDEILVDAKKLNSLPIILLGGYLWCLMKEWYYHSIINVFCG